MRLHKHASIARLYAHTLARFNDLGAHKRMATNNAGENAMKAACLEISLELSCRNTREAVLKLYLKRKDVFVTLPNLRL